MIISRIGRNTSAPSSKITNSARRSSSPLVTLNAPQARAVAAPAVIPNVPMPLDIRLTASTRMVVR